MLRSIILAALLTPGIFSAIAQVTFIIDSLPEYTPPEDLIYIAGDFQGWNPGDPAFVLHKNTNDQWTIDLEAMPAGIAIEFKFTRGSWAKVEKGEFGEEIPNRQFTFGNADTVGIIIFNWADYGGPNSTAAENVSILDDNFYMPQLNRYRKIWIYLPPDYDQSNVHYPVIYMHDGQNLFDAYTSFAGEWEVDETLNSIFAQGRRVPIVIGIENGGTERINEYTPWYNPTYGGGQGDLYIDFIVETLKPFVDDNYRTLPGRESTAVWGSSLGGLISHYGALKYQDVFSKAGIFSPSYWFSDSVWAFTREIGHQQEMKLYQITGSEEGGSMVQDTWKMHDTLTSVGFDSIQLFTQIITGAQHNEQFWRNNVYNAYMWLFDSYVISVPEYQRIVRFDIIPNPATDKFLLPDQLFSQGCDVNIYNMNGCLVLSQKLQNNAIDISALSENTYLIELIKYNTLFKSKFIKTQ